jgi:two-component system NtrC family response regulator
LAQDLQLHVTRALQYREEKLKTARPVLLKRDAIIGSSHPLVESLEQVAMVAVSDTSVLITGETGTGKELLARAIHENSPRSRGSFVIVDCAALPENLIESTLFGHVKGAFTGAERSRQGLVKMADGGTLFLDEIGELPLAMQKTFLRVLQEQSFRPVGASREERSDFRIIAATNRDIEKSVAEGEFRSDLFFRLQGFSLHVPPLRKRKEDIKPLAKHFLARLCERMQLPPKGISPEFIEHLEGYEWPGNVRELQQTLDQVFAMAVRQPTLFARHLPEHFRIRQAQAGLARTANQDHQQPEELNQFSGHGSLPRWKEYRTTLEREYLEELLRQSGGSIKEACRISGLSRARIYQLREKHGLVGIIPDQTAAATVI